MKIIDDFFGQRRRVLPRKPKREITRYDKQKLRHILDFLSFCGREYRLKKIEQIKQDHYTGYMRYLSAKGLGATTIYNHALSLREFIERAHLNIRINPSRALRRRRERLGVAPSTNGKGED